MKPFDLDLAVCRYVLELTLPEDLPALAVEALAAGYDVPALVELAGLHATETDRAHHLWRRALEELGRPLPSREEAALALVRDLARDLLSGAIDEERAEMAIRALKLSYDLEDERLHAFIYEDCEWCREHGRGALGPENVRELAAEILVDEPAPSQRPRWWHPRSP